MVSIHQSIKKTTSRTRCYANGICFTARKRAERIIIEAKGTRDAQNIISEGLTDQI
jgi:hypothetical protein